MRPKLHRAALARFVLRGAAVAAFGAAAVVPGAAVTAGLVALGAAAFTLPLAVSSLRPQRARVTAPRALRTQEA
jgi:hypothetical protein